MNKLRSLHGVMRNSRVADDIFCFGQHDKSWEAGLTQAHQLVLRLYMQFVYPISCASEDRGLLAWDHHDRKDGSSATNSISSQAIPHMDPLLCGIPRMYTVVHQRTP